MTEDVQRTLGRIEGLLQGIHAAQERLADELSVHTESDSTNFKILSDTLSQVTGARKATILWASGVSGALIVLAEVLIR